MNPYQAPVSEKRSPDPRNPIRPPAVEKSQQRLIKFCIFALFATTILVSFLITIIHHWYSLFF